MYAGRIVEEGLTREIIEHPRHPYTQGLMGALPQQTVPGQRLNQIKGMMPSLSLIPSGCAFHPRCPHVMAECDRTVPDYVVDGVSRVACHWARAERNAGGSS